ncbi:MAG: hypothetical protein GX750_03605 [Clostridia bacterium]|nr:hypothetical protein [Clostridia bacterium]
MPANDFPNPPADLPEKNKKRRRRQLAVLIALLLLFAIPTAAYYAIREYRGLASEVKTATEREQENKTDQKPQHGDLALTVEHAVWEDDELVLAYSINEPGFGLDECYLETENGSQITKAYYVQGGNDGGIIKFINMDPGEMENGQVWLRILSLAKQELYPHFFSESWFDATPEMKKGEFVEIKQELEAEQGTFLLTQIRFGSDDPRINFEFTPKEKYRQFYDNKFGPSFLPRLGLDVAGKKYRHYSVAGSMLTEDGPYLGTFYFDALPMEKVNDIRIGVFDSHLIVDWKLPIPVEHQESVRWALAEEIELPEGKLTLTGIRHGILSTAIDFTFKLAPGFEDISSLSFDAYLQRGGKYYNYHGPGCNGYFSEWSGTIIFDHVQYYDIKELEQHAVKELEFILGKITYTYDTDASVIISPASIPLTMEAMGSKFIIDRMEYQDGHTLLHIAYDQENRWFYNAHFAIELPPHISSYSIGQIMEMGSVQLKNGEELQQGLQRLKDNLGDDGEEILKDADLQANITGVNFRISDEHEEIEIKLEGLSAIRFSGEKVKIPVK